jgi:hypothetical protein
MRRTYVFTILLSVFATILLVGTTYAGGNPGHGNSKGNSHGGGHGHGGHGHGGHGHNKNTDGRLFLGLIGRYSTNLFDAGGAEIPAFDPASKRLFVTNAGPSAVDVLDISDPAAPTLVTSINCSPFGGGGPGGAPNSVAVHNGLLAIAVQNATKTNPGEVVFFDAGAAGFGAPLKTVTVGALPDMLCFTPDGKRVLVANEGEPNDAYTIDPEGSISIIDLSSGVAAATVQTAGFGAFNAQKAALIAAGVRIFGPESTVDEPDDIATVAQDLEPEYLTVSDDGKKAWATLQEANAIAIVDVLSATVTDVVPLGYKDHSQPENALDPSDRDGPGASPLIQFVNAPVFGMYQPDAIASFRVGCKTYLITANEGDARDYAGFSEEERIKGLTLDPAAFPNVGAIQADAFLGRLNSTTATGDANNDGMHENLYCYGARSFSIWDDDAKLVWDSGDALERIAAASLPLNFNGSNTNNNLDNRSDDKGPEPEAVTTAEIGDRTYAFVGLERMGGIVVYDVTDPKEPKFQTYVNTRDLNQAPGPGTGGDLGPEGIIFVPAADSPNGKDLLIVAFEISGSTAIYEISKLFD